MKEAAPELRELYDQPRNELVDAAFAKGMSTGMASYEAAVAPTKRRLFSKMLGGLPARDALVVELGMGTFPNAPFYAGGDGGAPSGMDLVGIDPNDSMASYARAAAASAGLLDEKRANSLRNVHGVGEALPFASGSVDAVVCTLTLCSVADQQRVLGEVSRVLRPGGGQFLFLEHVLSETDAVLAATQRSLTPLQVASADGCHLDRRTLEAVRAAPFKRVDGEYFELSGFLYLNPTVAGLAFV